MNNLSKVRKFVVSFVLDGKNFVMILNELRFSLKYDFVKEYGESYVKYFVMLVVVDGIKFEGFGRNKKLVKFRVVQMVFIKLFNLDFFIYLGNYI